VKVLWVEGKMAGIAAVGHGVSHLISAATIMVKQQWTVEEVHSIIWAHPTLDEALELAATAPRVAV
jgi:dihydrolipoamide dehydrogenase